MNHAKHAGRRVSGWAVVFVCLLAAHASAHFERIVPTARVQALGGAFVSVADDPAAVHTNPAGLALADTLGLLVTYHRPYGLPDLNAGYGAVTVPTRVGAFGLGFHIVDFDGGVSELHWSLGWARNIIRNSQDASLSVGLTFDAVGVVWDRSEAWNEADNHFTAGAGVLLRPFAMIGIGYSVRNLVAGDLDLYEGGLTTRIRTRQSWGVSYRWRNRVRVLAERSQDAQKVWRTHAGIEVVTHPNLHLRAGINRDRLTGGFGVLWGDLRVDVSVESHERLGPTYVFSIGFLPEVKRPYVQAQ